MCTCANEVDCEGMFERQHDASSHAILRYDGPALHKAGLTGDGRGSRDCGGEGTLLRGGAITLKEELEDLLAPLRESEARQASSSGEEYASRLHFISSS